MPEPARIRRHTGADLSRRLAAESVTLLKNEKGLLPLSHDLAKIAIVGPPTTSRPVSRPTRIPGSVLVRAGVEVAILAVGMGAPDLLKRTVAPKELARHAVGLNLTLMIVAVVSMPLAVAIHGAVFHHEFSLPWFLVAQVVFLQALLPFVAGLALVRWLPELAAPVERHGPRIVAVAMLGVAIVALIATWRMLIGLGGQRVADVRCCRGGCDLARARRWRTGSRARFDFLRWPC